MEYDCVTCRRVTTIIDYIGEPIWFTCPVCFIIVFLEKRTKCGHATCMDCYKNIVRTRRTDSYDSQSCNNMFVTDKLWVDIVPTPLQEQAHESLLSSTYVLSVSSSLQEQAHEPQHSPADIPRELNFNGIVFVRLPQLYTTNSQDESPPALPLQRSFAIDPFEEEIWNL